ncbi:hypothetical protein [Cupriavidus metallidurans]|uniref:hypothetical protein n=1 Tax=Cupriavidus metallidurans TaxID=119219 RepID=UPI00005501ED|nr:hypothetical protein [Cupriavidus metallidurans]QGS31161.1 hypothetical protein FOB83_19710 [Cupriavidus metallidurans]
MFTLADDATCIIGTRAAGNYAKPTPECQTHAQGERRVMAELGHRIIGLPRKSAMNLLYAGIGRSSACAGVATDDYAQRAQEVAVFSASQRA